jgi:hypothetical protein
MPCAICHRVGINYNAAEHNTKKCNRRKKFLQTVAQEYSFLGKYPMNVILAHTAALSVDELANFRKTILAKMYII